MLDKLTWLGHATFRYAGDVLLYIDPWKIDRSEEADIILVSHDHYDHFSLEDIDKIRGDGTVVVTVTGLKDKIDGDVRTLEPGQSVEVKGITIEAVPAYNIGKKFHPKENRWLGFVIHTPDGVLYYAGDTDVIDEMKQLAQKAIDVALVPVGGTYTMNAAEAARAVDDISPKMAVPYHWGDIVGGVNDARQFAEACTVETKILQPQA